LLQGNRPKINAVVDAQGIARLKQVLDKYGNPEAAAIKEAANGGASIS
jgi:hypothetical protein